METKIKHLISSSDLAKKDYDEMLRRFNYFKNKGVSPDLARGKIVSTLFFQPSTRTMNAFQSAIIRMGGGWIGVMGEKGLSMEKGESFEDTIREYSCFSDLIALRHPDDDSAERAAKHSFVPVLNCGSGSREHAVGTPWIVMMMSYYLKKQESFQGLKIGIYGTPEINRATKSIVPILGMYGVELFIDDLGHFPLPKEIEEKAKANGLKSLKYDKLDNFIGDVDILFLTRGLQKGIIPPDKFPKEKEEMILKSYKPITKEHMKRMKKDAILYMIKPRIFEVERDVDEDPRAAYAKREPYIESMASIISFYLNIEIG
ncbi:MAG: aspartate carbamoyltransferase catalytic subunit [Parcubacteria group bacterium Gr01-1014_107]|nr:MAG: aspartate carbamoyltransferase catalytic subunit [Parcubacteria group bacterium Gr01-1014_107]